MPRTYAVITASTVRILPTEPRSLKATCCGNHHSTEINLYTFSQDSEKSTRCTVTDLPPALVAEAPEPADISLGGEKTVGRCAPFVERGHVRCAGLRAPPVLA